MVDAASGSLVPGSLQSHSHSGGTEPGHIVSRIWTRYKIIISKPPIISCFYNLTHKIIIQKISQ